MTFLTLPSFPNTFAIFGGGFMVKTLSAISWLHTCSILYWGDIDAQGFEILALLRSSFPHVLSLMMDEVTLHAFANFCVSGTPCISKQLSRLTLEERSLYTHLVESNTRLEQEHISHAYALAYLQARMNRLINLIPHSLSEEGEHIS